MLSTIQRALVWPAVRLAILGMISAVLLAACSPKGGGETTVVPIQELSDGVRELSVQFGTDVVEATTAAYQAISAARAQPPKALRSPYTTILPHGVARGHPSPRLRRARPRAAVRHGAGRVDLG